MSQPALSPALTYNFQHQTVADTFALERNRMDIGSKRLLFGIGMFLIPTLIANAVFYTYFDLKGTGLLLATSITALMLLNVTIYFLNKISKGNRTLIFGYHDIKILQNGQLVHTIAQQDLKITPLNWETEEGNQQAIRLNAKKLPCMTIGCKMSASDWKNIQSTVDCTAFVIRSETEWKRLLNTLEYFNKDVAR